MSGNILPIYSIAQQPNLDRTESSVFMDENWRLLHFALPAILDAVPHTEPTHERHFTLFQCIVDRIPASGGNSFDMALSRDETAMPERVPVYIPGRQSQLPDPPMPEITKARVQLKNGVFAESTLSPLTVFHSVGIDFTSQYGTMHFPPDFLLGADLLFDGRYPNLNPVTSARFRYPDNLGLMMWLRKAPHDSRVEKNALEFLYFVIYFTPNFRNG